MKSFAGNGAECSTRLKTQLEAAFPGSQVSMDDLQTEEGNWSQSIAVRRGMWSGVDVEFKESEGRKTVEASAGSKGGSALILGAVVAALLLSFLMGVETAETFFSARSNSSASKQPWRICQKKPLLGDHSSSSVSISCS